MFNAEQSKLTATERLEMGMDLAQKIDRVQDSDLRILIFTAAYFVLDGVTLTIRRLEGHLRSRGATVKILTTVPDNLTAEELKDVIVVPGIKIPFNHAGDYSFGVGLDEHTAAQIEAFKPNCVHFTVPDFVALDGIRWCQKNNVAYMGTWHSNYIDYLKYYYIEWVLGPGFHRYLKGFFEQLPTVYVPTTFLLRKMRDEWGYGTATELKLWGRGVDMNIFSPDRRSDRFRASKGISKTDVVILWVGRLVPEKRPDIWMGVVKRLQDEGLPVKALVVGSGTFERYLTTLQHATCCGWLSGAALGEAYASSDILLFPSDVETFGNVTLEALSSGCPSIVEKKCGEHLVEHGVNGLTCQCGDAEAFYQATRKLVVETAVRKNMGVAARESAWKFERNIILQQMAENYKDAIEKHRDPAFLQRHLQNPEGAGRNLLSVFCCNYYFVKMIAEPFLNTSRGVQDLVDNTTECMQMSRSRLSCSDMLVSAGMATASANNAAVLASGAHGSNGALTELDLEKQCDSNKYEKASRAKRFLNAISSVFPNCFPSNGRNFQRLWTMLSYFAVVLSLGVVMLLVYAAYSVE